LVYLNNTYLSWISFDDDSAPLCCNLLTHDAFCFVMPSLVEKVKVTKYIQCGVSARAYDAI